MNVSNAQLVTVRDATRSLSRLIAALERNETDKFVLTSHGKMKAVLTLLPEEDR
jgi:2',3'-cyclic-nucleotide 2'-phosphodiesterase (5'-nucleotidase family)